MANLGAGLLTGFPAATSGSRTAVSDQMGGKSQWVGLIVVLLTIIFLLSLHCCWRRYPPWYLARVFIVASLGLLDVAAFRFLCGGVRPAEFWLAVVMAVGVLTVGILQGIVAVMLSLINVIFHISRPHDGASDDVDAAGGAIYAASPTKRQR